MIYLLALASAGAGLLSYWMSVAAALSVGVLAVAFWSAWAILNWFVYRTGKHVEKA